MISKYLEERLKKYTRKPLILRGARQIGKTYIIDEFAKKNYKYSLKINFEESPEALKFFETNNVVEIRQNLEIYFDTKLSANESLLFLDEIQFCPKAITSLRYFYEKMPEIDVIAAGSLLDHTLNDMQYSMPVGRVDFAYMYPMNFSEFLMALNENSLLDYIHNYTISQRISPPIHQKLMKLLRLYYFIGGMPEAVMAYVAYGNLFDVETVQESILKSLEFDFSKYGSRSQQELLQKLVNYIPKAVGRKFKFSNAVPEARSESVKKALRLLELSRIVHLVKSSSAASVPLSFGVREKYFKPLFVDIGLLNHQLKLRLTDVENLISVHEGNLAEQFVGQQLLSLEPFYLDKSLFYWLREKRNAEAEIDFVCENQQQIIPLEIKAGKKGTLKSLQVYMVEKKLKRAIRFNADFPSLTPVKTFISVNKKTQGIEFDLLSLPLYLVSEYERIFFEVF